MNILLTSQGQNPLMIRFFKKALNGNGKIFASNSKMTSTLLHADEYVLTPLIYDPSYIDFLIDYSISKNITAILSWYDIDLPILAKNKDRFRKHNITVVLSDESVIQLCNDKWKTHLFLKELNLKQPQTYVDLELIKEDLRSGMMQFPVFMKPRWGEGSVGIFQADTFEEIDILYEKILRIIFSTHLKYQALEDKTRCVIMQERLYGKEYGLCVFNDLQGNYIATIPKTKTEMQEGETIVSIVDSSTPFEYTGKTISQNLKHIGNIGVDCFITQSGDVVVIEINPRFAAHYPFAHLAGADFPKQIVEWLDGKSTSKNYIDYEAGVKGYKDLSLVIRI